MGKAPHPNITPVASAPSQPRRFRVLLLSLTASLSLFLPSRWSFSSLSVPHQRSVLTTDPASQWADDTWPLRPPTPWDISTDFPYPRTLTYTVREGTWLRLDVHPTTGDIVFDMAGDLYCLPASAYAQRVEGNEYTRARPVLLGVPHDADPHFAPHGEKLVFRSDAGLGVENIWFIPWHGCEAMDLRPESDDRVDGELLQALTVQDMEEDMLAHGVKETEERRRRRLIREGRLSAQRVTNETYRWVSDARFHPSGVSVIATKWYTSGRSLGAGEGWAYPIPAVSEKHSIQAGDGKRLIGRSLPAGWAAERYGDQQIGPEQFVWRGNDTLVYAQNVQDVGGAFEYSKDVHKGIYAIFSRNLTSGETETIVDAFPGGASRPELSRDARTLAFVRRVRDKEALVLKDLETGTIHHAWHGLSYDLSAVSAPMGTYPSFAFTPTDDAILIWAAGQIYHVPLVRNILGERTPHYADSPTPVRFEAHIEKRLAETRSGHAGAEILQMESAETQRVHAFRGLRVDSKGARVVFEAAGATYVQHVGLGEPAERVPVLEEGAAYYAPAFIPGVASDLVLHARWSDEDFSALEVANLTSGRAYPVEGLPHGRFRAPVASAGGQIALVKTGGDLLTGDVEATAGKGLYIGELTLPGTDKHAELHDLRFVPSMIDPDEVLQIRFVDANGGRLLVQQSRRTFIVNLGPNPSLSSEETLVEGRMSDELSVSSITRDALVAFVDFFHVYIVERSKVGTGELVWSRPANATRGLARVSLDGGHDVTWSGDGKTLFWFLGPYLHSLEVSKLRKCAAAIEKDRTTFGIACTRSLLEYQEIVVEHSTAVARLKQEAAHIDANANADVLVITNATILTMATERLNDDLIQQGTIVSRGGLIEAVGGAREVSVPSGAAVIDAQGGLVVPGFIDVHAHWDGFESLYPATSWEHETFLAHGVTTLHNPSADNVDGFVERSRVERGQLIGPRIFQTGTIIYGAGQAGYHQDIVDMDEARSALVRIKVEGGPASFSYKNYNLPSRASRQRLLLAAKNLSMLCVPEGGMNLEWDLTYIIDGMTTVEHALPVPTLYEDILNLYALSGTGATPTHVVNYGGAWGEQFVWAHVDIPSEPKLRRFTRHDILEGLSESTARPANSYALFNTSSSIAKMVKKGLRTHIGAHGEPPLGLNYHAEMLFTQQGGLSNYEVLKAATSSAAITLGLHDALGTLSSGKFADFIVYPPEINLLEGDIKHSRNIRYVVRGGRVWSAETMEEVWPVKGRKQKGPRINAE